MVIAAAMLVSVWGLMTALVLAHMPVGQPGLDRAGALAGRFALLGAPVMLLLLFVGVFGGALKSIDAASKAAALKRRGVKQVVEGKDFVAVLADNWWRADQALQALSIEWDGGANAAG